MSLAVATPILPATDDLTLGKLFAVQHELLRREQAEIPTDHLLHAGMYFRTITLAPTQYVMGALMKVPTVVTVIGTAKVYTGEWSEVRGYAVIPARAGRKQIFVALSAVIVTMAFPTNAKTVAQAEAEFTEEHELLLSRSQDMNTVRITGE